VHHETDRPQAWRAVGLVVLAGQFIWLLLQSLDLYRRFALTSDFALFYQAAHQIAAGHLYPTGTIYRSAPFLTNHFELLLYPLSLLALLDRGGLLLLVAQDLATVAAELVAFLWILDILGDRWAGPRRGYNAVALGALIVLAIDPWIWWADSFDFHLQAFATLFALLAARSFWHRRRTAWLWVVAALSCGTVEAAVLIGLGIAVMTWRRDQLRQGIGVLLATAVWIVTWSGFGFDVGSQLGANYRYLTGSANASLPSLALGALRHPGSVASHLFSKKRELWRFVAGSGFLGIASIVGLAMIVVVFVPGALNLSPYVVQAQSSFQLLPVLLFVPVGSVLACCWLASWRPPWGKVAVAVVGVAALVQVAVLSVLWIPQAPQKFLAVSPGAARVLDSVLARTPANAEVVSSNGFVGRFAGRPWVYTDFGPPPGAEVADEPVPLHAPVLELVLSPRQGIYQGPPAVTAAAIRRLQRQPGVTLLAQGSGIYAFVYRAPPGRRSFPLWGFDGSN
jgi:uncharacterized membrane protein